MLCFIALWRIRINFFSIKHSGQNTSFKDDSKVYQRRLHKFAPKNGPFLSRIDVDQLEKLLLVFPSPKSLVDMYHHHHTGDKWFKSGLKLTRRKLLFLFTTTKTIPPTITLEPGRKGESEVLTLQIWSPTRTQIYNSQINCSWQINSPYLHGYGTTKSSSSMRVAKFSV